MKWITKGTVAWTVGLTVLQILAGTAEPASVSGLVGGLFGMFLLVVAMKWMYVRGKRDLPEGEPVAEAGAE